jgi:hypothetical protein
VAEQRPNLAVGLTDHDFHTFSIGRVRRDFAGSRYGSGMRLGLNSLHRRAVVMLP